MRGMRQRFPLPADEEDRHHDRVEKHEVHGTFREHPQSEERRGAHPRAASRWPPAAKRVSQSMRAMPVRET